MSKPNNSEKEVVENPKATIKWLITFLGLILITKTIAPKRHEHSSGT
jgi:hypothetical protein